jgi:putative membrane protein
MKSTLLLSTAVVAALSLSACNKRQAAQTSDTGPTAAAGTTGGNDTSSMAQANPGQSTPVNAAQDKVGAAVGATSAATLGSHDTGAFVQNAGQGNMYEIEAAKIAEQKAQNPDVKAFAKMMVTDHTALENQMKPAITKSGKAPPAQLDQRRKGFLDNLNAAGPSDFDKVYIDQQVAAHKETLNLLKGYADNGDDPALKAVAAKAAPKVQAHLDRAQALQAKVEGKTTASNS